MPSSRQLLVGVALAVSGCAHPPRQMRSAPVLASAPPRCRPSGGGPYWLEEGQALAVTVRCATGVGDPLVVGDLPRGAAFDPATRVLRWQPALDQAGTYSVTARAGAERATVVIGVADAFDRPGNVPVADPAVYREEMGLPVLHIETLRRGAPHEYVPARVVFRGHVYQAKVKVRGRSSLAYPKNSYTIEFKRRDRFSEPAAGMQGRRRIAVTSTFDDNSQLRQRLAFELWDRLAPGGIQIRHFSAVVFLDGRYHGLYTVTDHVDVDLLRAQGLPAGGALFKAMTHDAGFGSRRLPARAFEKRSGFRGPAWLGSHDELASLAGFVQSDPAHFGALTPQRLALDEYRAWLILATAIDAEDSLDKNAYHYHDPASGRWRVVPWDFNHSFGQDWQTWRQPAKVDPAALVERNRLFQRLWEELGGETRRRYASALRGEIAAPVVRGLVDGWVTQLAPAAARDERRWRTAYRAFPAWRGRADFTDFAGEVAYLRRWIDERWAYLLGRMR